MDINNNFNEDDVIVSLQLFPKDEEQIQLEKKIESLVNELMGTLDDEGKELLTRYLKNWERIMQLRRAECFGAGYRKGKKLREELMRDNCDLDAEEIDRIINEVTEEELKFYHENGYFRE